MGLFDGIHIIGLTGQSGAGKSTVGGCLRDNGFSVIDADGISRRVSGSESFLDEVKRSFPECISAGKLDRRKMAGVVFSSGERLKKYTDIIYPYIIKEVFNALYSLKSAGERIVIFDAPTLFESGLDSICGCVISVVAPMEHKIRRILERDGIPVEMVHSRLSSQKSEEFFKNNSDYLINNDGDLECLKDKVSSISERIKERFNG